MIALLAAAAPADSVNHVWHFWLAVPLTLLVVFAVVGMGLGYFFRVVRTRYPQKK